MNVRTYAVVSAVIFGLVALVQLLRLIFQWPVTVDGQPVPIWVSVIVLIVAGLMCTWGLRAVYQIQRYI